MGFLRLTWGMSAAVWFVMIVLCCVMWGWPAATIAIIFGILPDISLIGAFAERGRLKPSKVKFYNTMHTMTIPVIMLIVGVILFFLTGAFPDGFYGLALAGLAWFVHIAADRTLGFGPRAADGTIVQMVLA